MAVRGQPEGPRGKEQCARAGEWTATAEGAQKVRAPRRSKAPWLGGGGRNAIGTSLRMRALGSLRAGRLWRPLWMARGLLLRLWETQVLLVQVVGGWEPLVWANRPHRAKWQVVPLA